MPEPLTVVEILERSEQGRTRPFLCRCDDDQLYFVKGRGAGQRSLLCEWLAGHLARAFGLPVPEFVVAQAPQGLIDLHPEGRDLGPGPAFASQRADFAQDVTVAQRASVATTLQRDVLVFDWWVHNGEDEQGTACFLGLRTTPRVRLGVASAAIPCCRQAAAKANLAEIQRLREMPPVPVDEVMTERVHVEISDWDASGLASRLGLKPNH